MAIPEAEHLVEGVKSSVGDVTLDVRAELGGGDLVLVEVENASGLYLQVVMAEGAKFANVLVGRYVFDGIPIDVLLEFVVALLQGQFRIEKKRVLWWVHYKLVVNTRHSEFDAFGSDGDVPLESWEREKYVGKTRRNKDK